MLQSDQDKAPTSWSHDGRFLLFQSIDPKTREDLWILPLEGDRKPFLFLGTNAREQFAQFSPAQRWIAYSAVSAANPEVFVRPFTPNSRSAASDAGPLWMVSSGGGLSPRWSADGKRLFYLFFNGDLMAVDIQARLSFQSGVPKRLFNIISQAGGAWALSPSSDRFLFIRASATSGPPPPFTMVLNWMAKLEQ